MSNNKNRFDWLLSPTCSLILFDILIIVTPFLMLMNYLQIFVKDIGRTTVCDIPVAPVIAILALGTLVFCTYKKINRNRLFSFVGVLIIIAISQFISDYYMEKKFYDLQNNWHYFAYFFFSMAYYRFSVYKNLNEVTSIQITICKGIIISLFDEITQVYIANRVFDLSDVAKDSVGVFCGLIFIYCIIRNKNIISDIRTIIHKDKHFSFNLLFNSAPMLLLNIFIFVAVFLFVSNLLAESEYVPQLVMITFLLYFITLTTIFYILRNNRVVKFSVATVIIALILSFAFNYNSGIKRYSQYLISYKGIPIPYFDVFVHSDGYPRLVSKKPNILESDLPVIFNNCGDILILGSGDEGSGGQGFEFDSNCNRYKFLFDSQNIKPVQLLILKNEKAFEVYNKLKNEGKNVSIIVHNS